MTNKLFKSFIVAMFLMFASIISAQAEMKCAPGKCGGQMMQDQGQGPKGMKCGAGKCDMKGPAQGKCDMKKCKDGKCDMKTKGKCNGDPKNCKCKDGKCDPKMKQKCSVDGKCPMQEPAKK